MALKIIGQHPLARDDNGKLKSRIGTIFPRRSTIITLGGIHATQRMAFLDLLNEERQQQGQPVLTREEVTEEWENAVDLVTEGDTVLIRPDPHNMPLAFKADELLQEIVPKHRIKFLYVLNEKVRKAIKRRGECWRITPLPKSRAEMIQMIAAAKMCIDGREIYYYSQFLGTRLLTCQEFAALAELDDAQLRQHLLEIAQFAGAANRLGSPEIRFFMADGTFSAADLAGLDLAAMDDRQLRQTHAELAQQFADAVSPEFRRDDPDDMNWRKAMYALLLGQEDAAVSEESLLGLSSEFFMQIQWLPGARIEEGELIFDPIFEAKAEPGDAELRSFAMRSRGG